MVRSGAHSPFDSYLGAHDLTAASPPLPPAWSLLPKVEFVRLAPSIVKQVARQAYRTGTFIKPGVSADRFPGGLSTPDDVSLRDGQYETLPFNLELHIASTDPAAINAWEKMDVFFPQVFVDDSVYQEISALLEDTLTSVDKSGRTEIAQALAASHPEAHESPVIAAGDDPQAASDDPQLNGTTPDDPYELKGRSDGVYILYKTAEQCARNAAFSEMEPADRRKFAEEIFENLLGEMAQGGAEERDRQSKLRGFFKKKRRYLAFRLIDPQYHPNEGKSESEWIDWPTSQGKAFLDQPDERRQGFVSEMLALMLGGTEYWLSLEKQEDPAAPTRRLALMLWLKYRGVIRTEQLRTTFEVIAWEGNGVPKLPESS